MYQLILSKKQNFEKMNTFSRPKMNLVKAYIVDLVEFKLKWHFHVRISKQHAQTQILL